MMENKNTVRLNKDLAREQHFFSVHSNENEKVIIENETTSIRNFMSLWLDIIVDNTHFNTSHKERIQSLCKENNYEFIEKFFNTWLQTCIRRNENRRTAKVPQFAIENMYNKAIELWYKFEEVDDNKYIPDTTKPKAVIFDIDGTLAKMNWRSPYDYTENLMTDILNTPIYNLYNLYKKWWYEILIFTWRKKEWDEFTHKWLNNYWITYTEFMSRADWDDRCDTIIKKEFFDLVKDKYNIELCVDDRDRVVDMYRWLWLTVLQVDYWNF